MLGALVVRIPIGMYTVSIVLLARGGTGSFASAAWVLAAFALGAATGLPLWGRVIDRLSPRVVMAPLALVQAAGLLGLVLLARNRHGVELWIGPAFLTGATEPPVGPVLRASLPRVVAAPTLASAYAVEAVTLDVIWLVGPLLAGGLIAVASPSAAVVAQAALLGGGMALMLAAPVLGRPTAAEAARRGRSALRTPGVRAVIVAAALVGAGSGLMDIGLPAFATDHGSAASVGILFALISASSIVGGLVFGSRSWPGTPARQYALLAVLFGLALGPLVLVGSIAAAGAVLLLAGLFLAPVTVCEYAITDRVAPAAAKTEAFTWLTTINIVGAAGGAAIAGSLIEGAGTAAVLGCSALLVLGGGLYALARRRALERPGDPEPAAEAAPRGGEQPEPARALAS